MPVSSKLIGQLLGAGLGGYAGSAASALLANNPELGESGGPGAFDLWKQHLEERLSELATALSFESPELFSAGSSWARIAFEARGVPLATFVLGLGVLEAELVERLPEGAQESLTPYFEAAHAALVSEAYAPGLEHLEALQFLELALEGDSRQAAQQLLESYRGGATVVDLFELVVVPAQREVGRLWHEGEINVAEEHVATMTTQKAIAVLAHEANSEPAKDKAVVISSVPGDAHDLGQRLLADLFALAGWRSVLLGADVPRIDLLQALDAYDSDLLVLSATLTRHLLAVRSTIKAVRERSSATAVKVLVGGRAFRDVPELWRAVGADGWAASLREALAEGQRLVLTD